MRSGAKKDVLVRSLVVGPLATNCHILACRETSVATVIDPGFDATRILALVEELGLQVAWVLLTHGHVDHVSAAAAVVEATTAQVAIGAGDVEMLQAAPEMARFFGLAPFPVPEPGRLLADGDTVSVGTLQVRVLHTPGHTPGSVCYHVPEEALLFSGDTLFFRGVGRTDLPGGSWSDLVRSIRTKLYTLDGTTQVLTGHGPATILREEMLMNPFVTL